MHFYPPRRKGIPAYEVNQILENHVALLNKIKIHLGLTPEEYDTLILPVITRFTEFVHLLPASENHHHYKAGGLLRHSLETGYYSARHATLKIWPTSLDPRTRRTEIPRWYVSMFLAGLLHDLGKTVMDIEAIAPDGGFRWDPYHLTLLGWCKRNNHEEYYIRYLKDRGQDHSAKAMSVAHMVLPKRTVVWLRSTGPKIYSFLTDYLSGVRNLDTDYKQFCNIVTEADSFSTAEDLKLNASINSHETNSQAVETFLIRAMKKLVDRGRWTVNEKGSRLWMLKDGLYITWPQGGKDLADALDNDLIPGIQREANALGDLLIERAIAIPYQDDEKTTDVFWPFIPEVFGNGDSGKTVVLHGLKIKNPNLLFGSVTPETIEGIVGLKAKEILYKRRKEREEKKNKTKANHVLSPDKVATKSTSDNSQQSHVQNQGPQRPKKKSKKKQASSTNQKKVLAELKNQIETPKASSNKSTPLGLTEEPLPNKDVSGAFSEHVQQNNEEIDTKPSIAEDGGVESLFNEPAAGYVEASLNETDVSRELASMLHCALNDGTLSMGPNMWINSYDELCIAAPDYLSNVFADSTEDTALAFYNAGYLSPFTKDANNLFREDFTSGKTVLSFCKSVTDRLNAEENTFDTHDTGKPEVDVKNVATGTPADHSQNMVQASPHEEDRCEQISEEEAFRMIDEANSMLSSIDTEELSNAEDQFALIRNEGVSDEAYEIANRIIISFMAADKHQNPESITPEYILITTKFLKEFSKENKIAFSALIAHLNDDALGWKREGTTFYVSRSSFE